MIPDQINSCFELTAGILLIFNVWRAYQDKQVRGVSIIPMAFMVLWGLWNCHFYPFVGAPWSFWAGLFCTTINATWIGQMIYYRKKKHCG